MSSNQKTRSPSGSVQKQKVIRGQNLSHRQVAQQQQYDPSTNGVGGWFSPHGSLANAPKRIFPSQTGTNSFNSTQIVNKKHFREGDSSEQQPTQYQAQAQWESTLDNPGIQHKPSKNQPGYQGMTVGEKMDQQQVQSTKHRKMQNIQTANFNVVQANHSGQQTQPHGQPATMTNSYNLSPMAGTGTFQFDLQQQQHLHQVQMQKLQDVQGQDQVNTMPTSASHHFQAQNARQQVRLYAGEDENNMAFNQTQQIRGSGYQYSNDGTSATTAEKHVIRDASSKQSTVSAITDSNQPTKVKKRLVSKSGGQRKNSQQVSNSQASGAGALRLIQTRSDRQPKAETIKQDHLIMQADGTFQVPQERQVHTIRARQQHSQGYAPQPAQANYQRVGMGRSVVNDSQATNTSNLSVQPPQMNQPMKFEQMNFTANLNGISSLVDDDGNSNNDGLNQTTKTNKGQISGSKASTLGTDKRDKSSRKPSMTTSQQRRSQVQATSANTKAVLLKQNDQNQRGVKMQRIQAFNRSDFNNTMRVPVSTKNASNKKTFLAVATNQQAEQMAAQGNERYSHYANQVSEVTAITPIGNNKVGLRGSLAAPKIMGSSRSTANGANTSQPRKASIANGGDSTPIEIQKQLAMLQSNQEADNVAGLNPADMVPITSQSQTSKHQKHSGKQNFISISHISNKSGALQYAAEPQKVKLASSKSSKQKPQTTGNNQQQLMMQIQMLEGQQDHQLDKYGSQESGYGKASATTKASAINTRQGVSIQKQMAYDNTAQVSIKHKSQERVSSAHYVPQNLAGVSMPSPGYQVKPALGQNQFQLNNVTSVGKQQQIIPVQGHVIASSTTNKVKKSFNFEVEPSKSGPGNKSTTNQAHKGASGHQNFSMKSANVSTLPGQQTATGAFSQMVNSTKAANGAGPVGHNKVRQQKVSAQAPQPQSRDVQKRAPASSQPVGKQLQSNSLSNSRKVLKMTDQILKGLNQVSSGGQSQQPMHKKVKIVGKGTSISKPPAHDQYFGQVGGVAVTSKQQQAFTLQQQLQAQPNLQKEKKQLLNQNRRGEEANPLKASTHAKASNSNESSNGNVGGNTVININIDNRGSTSSYSHLVPGHINPSNIVVNASDLNPDELTNVRTPVAAQSGQRNRPGQPPVTAPSNGSTTGNKKTSSRTKDQLLTDGLFSPKGIQVATGKAMPSSTRARHPKSFVFKEKVSGSASRVRDDSSLIARTAGAKHAHTHDSAGQDSNSQSNAKRRKMDSSSKVIPQMNQEETMAMLSKLLQKTGQPNFGAGNIKTAKRKSIEKPQNQKTLHQMAQQNKTDLPSARSRGPANGGKATDFDDMWNDFEAQVSAARKPVKKSTKTTKNSNHTASANTRQTDTVDSSQGQQLFTKVMNRQQQNDSSEHNTHGTEVAYDYEIDDEEKSSQLPTHMVIGGSDPNYPAGHKRINSFASQQYVQQQEQQKAQKQMRQNVQNGKLTKNGSEKQGGRSQAQNQQAAGGSQYDDNFQFNNTQPLSGIGKMMNHQQFQLNSGTSPLANQVGGGHTTTNAQGGNIGFLNKQEQQQKQNANAYMSLVSSNNNAPRANRQPIIFDEQVAEQEAQNKQKSSQPPHLVPNQFFYNHQGQEKGVPMLNQSSSPNLLKDEEPEINGSVSPSKRRSQKGPQTKKSSQGPAKLSQNDKSKILRKDESISEVMETSPPMLTEEESPNMPEVSTQKHARQLSAREAQKEEVPEWAEPTEVMKGSKALKMYGKSGKLTDYEKLELMDVQEVYFLGIAAADIKIKGRCGKKYNDGYDDEPGDYTVVTGDHIGYRFEVLDFLGKGSFGQALKVMDHLTGEITAIKIIRNKKKFQHQAGVELKILQHLQDNDPDDRCNIIQIKAHIMFRQHLIISFELFSINLYEFIKSNNFQGFSLSLIRRFAIQILQALKYLREQDIIHCDLKPENILLKSPEKSGIKIIDFGSSCFSDERIYTYIQSRFYRAPEIILGIPYTTAIDMWSFGCILTELCTGIPIFPGESEHEQLSLIMQVVGLPPDYLLTQATRKSNFFQEDSNQPLYGCEDSTGNLRIPSTRPLTEIFGNQSDSFLDFITQCLEWDPEKRITPFEALLHPWIIEGLPAQVLVHHQRMLGLDVPSSQHDEDGQNEHTDDTSHLHAQLDNSSSDGQYADTEPMTSDHQEAQLLKTQPVPQQFLQNNNQQFYPSAADAESQQTFAQSDAESAQPADQNKHRYHPTDKNYQEEQQTEDALTHKKKAQTSNVSDILQKLNSHLSKHAHQPQNLKFQ